MAADITLIPASAEGAVIEQLQKEVQGVPGTTDQAVLSFYGFDTDLFDMDVYVEDDAGASSPAATTRGLGIGGTSAGPSTPSVPVPAPTGTGIATAVYEAPTDGVQTIKVADATWFGDVGIVTNGGKSMPLSFGTGYTFTAGELTVLAAAGVQGGNLITYTYASGTITGQQPTTGLTPAQAAALAQVSAPMVALVEGVATGFATPEEAFAVTPAATVIRVNTDVTVSTTTASRFNGLLLGNGSTISVADGAQLRLGRYTVIKDCIITAPGTGTLGIVGTGNPTAGLTPPGECVQIVDSAISLPIYLGAATSYQGLAIRGSSSVALVASGSVPLYLYDLATITTFPVGCTLIDERPGVATTTGLPLATTRSADYTLALSDADKLVPINSASAVTVTVPNHASVPFPVGTTLYVAQDAAGQVTITPASGVVVQTADGYKVGGQWLDVALHKRDLNTWVLKGGVS